MKALVTGAAGFIGSTLVDRLMADGHAVVGVDDLSTGLVANLAAAERRDRTGSGRFRLVETDIVADELGDIVGRAQPDVVFHLAAHVDLRASVAAPQMDARTNVLGTINVAEACRDAGVRRIVYAASGGSRYGTPEWLPVAETAPTGPMSPYAAAKIAGELYLSAYAATCGLAPISLGLANVYGPRQDPRGEAGVIALFSDAMTGGRPTAIYGDGEATRDYVFVGDVVDAFVRAAAAPLSTTGLFNVGTGRQTSVNEVHRMIAMAARCDDAPTYAPARPGEVPAIALDSGKARRVLGWVPTVGLAEGIGRTLEWLGGSDDAALARPSGAACA